MLTTANRPRLRLQAQDRPLEPDDGFTRLVRALDELELYVEVELGDETVATMDPWVADDDALAIRALSL
jgi:hypothetical protein